MRLHRFYLKQKLNTETIIISEERLLKQWKNVFRYKIGDKVLLFNGEGKEYIGEIKDLKKENGKIEILEEKEGIIPSKNITLYQSLIKKDNMEWVVQKVTELGVSKIVPVISERSEKKGFNIERAKKIAVEASEQCGRADIPEISEVQNLKEYNDNFIGEGIVFDSSGSPLNSSSLIDNSISIFIGPEGGWSQEEIEKFKNKRIKIFSLGKMTLRAETAAISALTIATLLDSEAP